MRIATFNINGIERRLTNLLQWLNQTQPKVVCLQELKCTDARFPAAALEHAGYGAVWLGQARWNGVAILSRGAQPILTRTQLPGDPSDLQSRYIEAAIEGILVGCLYAPNGNPFPGPKYDYKLAWNARLIALAKELLATSAPLVLAGDYNIIPTPFDMYVSRSWDDNALLQPAARADFEALKALGLVDALRTLHPKAACYTFWDYMRGRWERDAGMRLDHFLVNADVARRLKSAGVDRAVRGEPGASDHAPAWIELKRLTSGAAPGRRSKTT